MRLSFRYPHPAAPVALATLVLASFLAGMPATAQSSAAGATTSSTSAGYHVATRVRLGGPGGWDYLTVDTAAHRLYLSRGTHVMVVDTRADTLVGDLPDTPGVHGIALAPELGRGWTSNGRDSSVTVFDPHTLAATARVTVTGRNPDAITYDAATRRVFTFNGGSANATVLDAATGAVLGTIPLGGKPEFAVTDGRGTLWVNVEDRGEMAVVDTRRLTVRARWALAGCEEPSGLAIDQAHRRLFAVCGNGRMVVVDADRGRVVATVPIGRGPDAAAFDPARQLTFSSNGADGTLTVVHEDAPDRYRVVQTVATQRGARTMALDPSTHRVYLVTADFGAPPPPTPERPTPRPAMVPDSFTLLVVEP